MRYGEIYKHACMETTAARPQRSRHCIHHTDSSQILILSRAPSLLSRARGNPVLHCRTLVSTPLYPPSPWNKLTILAEEGDQALRKRVREHELGADDEDLMHSQCMLLCNTQCACIEKFIQRTRTHLGSQSLEERAHTFLLDHLLDNGGATDAGSKVGVLDTGLDDVERRSDGDGSDGTGDGSHKVYSSVPFFFSFIQA